MKTVKKTEKSVPSRVTLLGFLDPISRKTIYVCSDTDASDLTIEMSKKLRYLKILTGSQVRHLKHALPLCMVCATVRAT